MADAIYYQGDEYPHMRATLTRNDSPISLDGKTVAFRLYRKGREAYESPVVSGAAQIVGDPALGVAEYQWVTDDLDRYGNFTGIFVITDGGEDEAIPVDYLDILVRPAAT